MSTKAAMLATVTLASSAVAAYSPTYYPADINNVNNLTYVINGKGTNGIYDSSKTPDRQYGEYNWCNMPHVRSREYQKPKQSSSYELEYVEVIHRHHKRTPYASNTFYKEDVKWDCNDYPVQAYAKGAKGVASDVAAIGWLTTSDPANPFTSTAAPGFVGSSCQFPQITDEGLVDSHQHGLDLAKVYRDKLGFLPKKIDPKQVSFRVTNNVITSQVLGALITGLFPKSEKEGYNALIQSSSVDSLEPKYSCNAAGQYDPSSMALWQEHLTAAKTLYNKLDSVSGIASDDGGWHASFDHYFDNLSAKLCHSKSLPCSLTDRSNCVSQTDADAVFRLGQYEYATKWRGPTSPSFVGLKYGAWLMELRSHLTAKVNGTDEMLYRHNVAHDGSISPLLGFFQPTSFYWPGMGTEVVFELWTSKASKKNKGHGGSNSDGTRFVRVLVGGLPLETSTPLGTLDWVPLNDFFGYLTQQLPGDLVAECNK